MSATLSPAITMLAAVAGTNAPDDKPLTFRSPYGYVPTKWICYVFLVGFAVSFILHLAQATKYRTWFMYYTACFAVALEVLGWSSRLWSSYNISADLPYKLQICATIIAPTPLLAVNFVVLGRLVNRLGAEYSRLTAKYYTTLFFSADFIALIVQAAGGALAATSHDPTLGGHIMLGGIIYQLVMLTIFVIVAGEFLLRHHRDSPLRSKVNSQESGQITKPRKAVLSKSLQILVAAFAFNTFCLYIRAIYRTVELSDGWTGEIILTEKWFNWFDATMILLATYAINFAHPGRLLDLDSNAHTFVIQPSKAQQSAATLLEISEPKIYRD